MIEQLFGSKTRVKLLQLFMTNPNRSFYVREITRKIDEQINSVRRELANLLSVGIITSDTNNNRLYYEVDQKFEHYEALASIFGGKRIKKSSESKKNTVKESKNEPNNSSAETIKIEETANPLLDKFRKTGNLKIMLLCGQFTRDESSGADLLLVGDLNISKVEKAVSELEATENKEIRYAVFGLDEFMYRKQINDRFVTNLITSKKQVLLDSDGYL